MGCEQPDTISITVEERGELAADHVDLFVTVEGSSYVTGRAALTQAREVAALVEALRRLGVSDGDVQLLDISAQTSGGLISRTSSATYELRVRGRDPGAVGDLVGAVTGQKNTRLRSTTWGFPSPDEARARLLPPALARARAEADLVSQGLGVDLVAVHSFTARVRDLAAGPAPRLAMAAGGPRGRAEPAADELGLDGRRTKEIVLEVQLSYRVSPLHAAPRAQVVPV